jgi:hypothetical protein
MINEWGWNLMSKKIFKEDDFDILSSILKHTHGMSLNKESSFMNGRKDIVWIEKGKGRDRCLGTCRYIEYTKWSYKIFFFLFKSEYYCYITY